MKDECEELDIKIAKQRAERQDEMVDDDSTAASDFEKYIETVRKARHHERVAASNRHSAQYVQDYIAQQITMHDQELSEENADPLHVKLLGFAREMIKKAEEEVYKTLNKI